MAISTSAKGAAGILAVSCRCSYRSAMSVMSIYLPDDLRSFVDEQASACGCATSGEYIRELICRDRDRSNLRKLLFDGASSPATRPADALYFAGLRDRAHRQQGV
jgi:antitoxin ParD1/3/4